MRIISKFSDYYDSAMGYGIDKSVVYERETSKYDIKSVLNHVKELTFQAPTRSFWNIGREIEEYGVSLGDYFAVFFCGKPYIGVRLSVECKSSGFYNEKVSSFFYDNESISRFIGKYSDKIIAHEVDVRRCLKNASKSFEKHKNFMRKENHEIHFEMNSPVVFVGSWQRDDLRWKIGVTTNPVLKDYEFFKKVDAFTAFQELSMYISGVMGGRSPRTIEISNEDKIAKHGFDKWSFRKESSKRSQS